MKINFVTGDKIAETSSKGNQEKWYDNDSGMWYKLDQFGYEALSEAVISSLLEKSNIESDFPFKFVRYDIKNVTAHKHKLTACSSKNFLQDGQSIITLSHLFARIIDVPLKNMLERLSSDKKRIAYIAEKTAEFTGLGLFPQYLTLIFEVDALFLNDDRHLNNIALLERDGKYDYCPIFDNGAGLLSNTQLYRMDIEPKALMREVYARPFNTTFNRQRNTAENLYGNQLKIPKFMAAEIGAVLKPFLEFYPERDRGIIADRVTVCILERQKHHYLYK